MRSESYPLATKKRDCVVAINLNKVRIETNGTEERCSVFYLCAAKAAETITINPVATLVKPFLDKNQWYIYNIFLWHCPQV